MLEAVESLKTKGFINFYGTQPFGNNSVFLRGVGCELLKGNWQQVRMLGSGGGRLLHGWLGKGTGMEVECKLKVLECGV